MFTISLPYIGRRNKAQNRLKIPTSRGHAHKTNNMIIVIQIVQQFHQTIQQYTGIHNITFGALNRRELILSVIFITSSKLYIAAHSFLGPHNSFLKNADFEGFFRTLRFSPGNCQILEFLGPYDRHTDFILEKNQQKRMNGFVSKTSTDGHRLKN